MKICIYGSSSDEISKGYIKKTEELGEFLGSRGHSLIFGGGASGLMGAAARGFHRASAKITGVVPSFFNVDGIIYEHCDELIRTPTMRVRKEFMDDLSDAFITTPGGVGTFDEFFEMITLKQLGQNNKPMVIYNIDGYFDNFYSLLLNCVEGGFMPHKTVELVHKSENIEDIAEYIENYKPIEFNILDYKRINNN